MQLASQDVTAISLPESKIERAILAAISLSSGQPDIALRQDRWLAVGEVLHCRRQGVTSDKVFGQQLKADLPDLAKLPASDRADATWLHRKMTGDDKALFLQILGVEALGELTMWHPSAIRRTYNKKVQAR